MDAEPITIMVDPEAARTFREVSPEEQQQIGYDLAVRLRRRAAGRRPPSDEEISALMDRVGRRAESSGLTPEDLKSILDEK